MTEKPNSVKLPKSLLKCKKCHMEWPSCECYGKPHEPVAELAEPSASPGMYISETKPHKVDDVRIAEIFHRQPAAACTGISACTQKEACLKVNRCLINLPQPVAGLQAREALESLKLPKCGENASLPIEEVCGCGQQIHTAKDLFRCGDCEIPFHRQCLKKHFAGHEASTSAPEGTTHPRHSEKV